MTYTELKNKMPEITGFLLTQPDLQKEHSTEVWIKFRRHGVYVFIDLEQPLPSDIQTIKLVGAGNALNCSNQKKDDELMQYNDKNEICKILTNSINFKGNMTITVNKVLELFDVFTERFLHYE